MSARYEARWVTADETARLHHHNGVVEQVWPEKMIVGYFGPMAFAQRIAFALNLSGKFSLDELKAIDAGLDKP